MMWENRWYVVIWENRHTNSWYGMVSNSWSFECTPMSFRVCVYICVCAFVCMCIYVCVIWAKVLCSC